MLTASLLKTDFELAMVDSLASAMVQRALPVRFRLANSISDLHQAFRLRYQVVIEKGWAKPEKFPDGIERDAYDDRAAHILAVENGEIVGTSRLVFPKPGSYLPTEEAFGVIFESKRGVADIGRICLAPGYRGKNLRPFFALLGQTWIEMRNRGCTRALAAIKPSVARVYMRWGLKLKVLGTVRNYWGEERCPVLISPVESKPPAPWR